MIPRLLTEVRVVSVVGEGDTRGLESWAVVVCPASSRLDTVGARLARDGLGGVCCLTIVGATDVACNVNPALVLEAVLVMFDEAAML